MKTNKKKYDTIAICNALMDIEIKVTEAEFAKLGFTKGSMSLVTPDKSHQLLKHFANKAKRYSSGGSVGNTMYAMSKFGSKVAAVGVVGDDEFGRRYRADFKKAGVDFLGVTGSGSNGVCIVFITPDAARTLVTTLGCAADFTPEIVQAALEHSTRSIYIESYLLTSEKNIALLRELAKAAERRRLAVILSDSDAFCVEMFPAIYETFFRSAKIFFANADQFKAIAGYNRDAEVDIEKLFHRYAGRTRRPKLFVVTHSSQGAFLSLKVGKDVRKVHVPAGKVKVVDSNGAGDGFAAGVMSEYFKGASITAMGKRGNKVAARIITRFGARYR